jgi:N-acyl-D-aspartate/D-glutamate deacylase
VVQADGVAAKRALLEDPAWRAVARQEWDTVDKSMFPNTRIERVRIVETSNPDDEKWIGKSLADLVAARGGHPSDVFADFALANGCTPGIVAVGVANDDIDLVASGLVDDHVLISSSDAGAHVQMQCASGDTTLLLTRHVREREDLTLERAVYELTARQAEAFGFRDRGVVAEGNVADLVVFALDELHWDDDEFVADMPGGAKRFRRPEGGYRATVVDGVAVQEHGELTGSLPGRVLDVNA